MIHIFIYLSIYLFYLFIYLKVLGVSYHSKAIPELGDPF